MRYHYPQPTHRMRTIARPKPPPIDWPRIAALCTAGAILIILRALLT